MNDPFASLRPQRAKSRALMGSVHLVSYRGATYVIHCRTRFSPHWWVIKRRGQRHIVMVIEEKHGLGKEEAIAWIEANC